MNTQFDISSDITERTWQEMKAAFDGLPNGAKVDIMIGSYGGEAFVAFSMLDYLHLQKGFCVTAYVLGRAMSAAAFLAIGCDLCFMSPYGELMFHSAYTPDGEGEKDKAIIDINNAQLALIQKRCAQVPDSILDKDTFITAAEAQSMGLIDGIINNRSEVLAHYLSTFKGFRAMNDEVKNEIVEEVKEEVAEQVQEGQATEAPAAEDIIEKLIERVNDIEARLCSLEGGAKCEDKPAEEPVQVQEEEPSAECKPDEQQARLNALYAKITKPVFAKSQARAEITKRVPKGFKNYING